MIKETKMPCIYSHLQNILMTFGEKNNNWYFPTIKMPLDHQKSLFKNRCDF